MKKYLIIMFILVFTSLSFAATTQRGFIGKEDLKNWNGITSTFTRKTSTGGSQTLTRIGNKVDLEGAYGATFAGFQNACSSITSDVVLQMPKSKITVTAAIAVPSNIKLDVPYGGGFTDGGGDITFPVGYEVHDSWFSTIDYAEDCVNASNVDLTFYLNETRTMTANLSFDSDVLCVPIAGKIITLGTNDLTINNLAPTGDFQWINENDTGTVSFGEGFEVKPNWWGIDGVADDVQINSAITSLASGGIVKVKQKTYNITAKVEMDTTDVALVCDTPYAIFATSTDIDMIETSAQRLLIENIKCVQSNGSPTQAGFRIIDDTKVSVFRNCWSADSAYAYELNSSASDGILYNLFENCHARGSITYDYYLTSSGADGVITENNFHSCTSQPDTTTGKSVYIEKAGTHYPNGNRFYTCSFEQGMANAFAAIDEGRNRWLENRFESNGRGIFFDIDSTGASGGPSFYGNQMSNTQYPQIVIVNGGGVKTDLAWTMKFEGILYGNGYTGTTVDVESASGQKVVSVADTSTFIENMPVLFDEGNADEEWGTIDSIQDGVSITMRDNLVNTHEVAVTVQGYCKPTGRMIRDYQTQDIYVFGNNIATFNRSGTTGDLTINETLNIGELITFQGTPQSLTSPAASNINATTSITELTTTGASALSMSSPSFQGQLKTVVMVSDGGDGVLNVGANLGFTSVTWNDVNDTATFQWCDTLTKWVIYGYSGVTVVP